MRLIDRYLIKGFIFPFIACIFFFIVLFIIIDGFNNLDEFIKNHVAMNVIASYYFYLLPTLLVQIVPISALASLLLILGNLSKHNEIVALKASGISSVQILTPYLFMGMLVSFLLFLVNETVVPHAAIASASIKEGLIEKRGDSSNSRSIKNVAVYGSEGRMIYAREFEVANATLHDVVVLEDRRGQILKSKLTAKKAKFDDGKWVFYNVIHYRVDVRGELLDEPQYSEQLTMELKEKPEDFTKGASQIDFMSARQLREYIRHLKGANTKLLNRLWVDFHYKIAFPFISFIVMLIGAPLAMKSERSSAMVGIGTSFVLVVLYYALQSFCLAMGKGGHLPPLAAAWLTNLIFALTGIYLIKKTA